MEIIFWACVVLFIGAIGYSVVDFIAERVESRIIARLKQPLRDTLKDAHPRMRMMILQSIIDEWCPVCGQAATLMTPECYHVRIASNRKRMLR